MLAELTVENLVLIERVRLELAGGLNAFTGETGAGKSLLIDALGLLFGARGDPSLIRPGAERAEVSARFLIADAQIVAHLRDDLGIRFDEPAASLPEPGRARSAPPTSPKSEIRNPHSWELVVSRSLPREGRARAHANGRPIAVAALRELGNHLLDIHGQHANQSLLRPATRLEILDCFAGALPERAAVRRAYEEARGAAEALAELRRAARERQGREDLYRFQLKELDEARLDEIEPETLESDLNLLRGAERIRDAARLAAESLDGEEGASAANLMGRALKDLENLGEAGEETAALAERLEGLLAEARELARDFDALAEKARSDPERLAELEETRGKWRALERKHGRGLEALRALRDERRLALSELARLDERTGEREAALAGAVACLEKASQRLRRKRKTAAKDLERRAAKELAELGLKDAALQVRLTPHGKEGLASADEARRMLPPACRPSGTESAELLFSANPELPQRPLAECASGGELSRVMLALKGVLAQAGGADRLPVVVFDEVDSGVGGRTGAVLGRKLAALARVRQVLCVTHLPQVAVYAQRQIKVEKQRAKARPAQAAAARAAHIAIAALEGPRRVDELALMLRGAAASKRTRAEAAEMLRAAQDEARAPKRAASSRAAH